MKCVSRIRIFEKDMSSKSEILRSMDLSVVDAAYRCRRCRCVTRPEDLWKAISCMRSARQDVGDKRTEVGRLMLSAD